MCVCVYMWVGGSSEGSVFVSVTLGFFRLAAGILLCC